MSGKSPFQLWRPGHFRRSLNVESGDESVSLEALLEANQQVGKYRDLLNTSIADLREDTSTLLRKRKNPLCDHPLPKLFEGTEVNRIAFAPRTQTELELYRYENVYFVGSGSTFAIFRGQEIDGRSTGLILSNADELANRAIHIDRGAFCDDKYRPGNPCHFMVDRLPRAHFFRTRAGLPEDMCMMVAATAPYTKYALERVAPKVRLLEAGTLYHFDELYLLSSSANPRGHPFYYMRPEVMRAVLPKVTRGLPDPSGKRRIYMSRFATGRRPLQNEKDVAKMLKKRGFEILEMSELTPFEQLSAVREAELVVAPHGAALASIVAATPQTKIVELMSPKKATAAYAALSLAVNAPYTPVFGKPDRWSRKKDAWRINVKEVEAALEGEAALPTMAEA